MKRRLRLALVGLFFAQQFIFVGVNTYQALALLRSDWGVGRVPAGRPSCHRQCEG